MSKCYGELTFIIVYVVVFCAFLLGLVHQIKYAKPLSLLIEFAICLCVDQIKAIPLQTMIYYIVVRRCGIFEVTPDFEGVWEDDKIFIGGQEMSLFSKIRHKIEKFIETPLISNIILGMTIFLCIVIFTELAIADAIE